MPLIRRFAVGALLGSGLLGAVVVAVAVAVALASAVRPNTLPFELAKAALQLVTVGFLGSAAAIAVFICQERVRQRALVTDRRQDATLREEERQRDARLRLDGLRRRPWPAPYGSTTASRACVAISVPTPVPHPRTGSPSPRTTGFMAILIDQQLQFEELKGLSPMLGDQDLRAAHQTIETYLGQTCEEYEDRRADVAAAAASSSTSCATWIGC